MYISKASVIDQICFTVFGEYPKHTKAQVIGICNEVFEIRMSKNVFILRMSDVKRNITGTGRFLPWIKSLGIPTFDMIAENYDMSDVPYCYQVVTKVEGNDLEIVLPTLTAMEIKDVAVKVSAIIDKFKSLPLAKKFGIVSGVDEEHYSSQLEMLLKERITISERNKITGVISRPIWDISETLILKYSDYLLNANPILHYDDLVSKNVMINKACFVGLVDLDFLKRGDLLELVGKIYACWNFTTKGRQYVKEIIKCQQLGPVDLEIVKVYALFTLVNWLSEVGVKFNSNTSGLVNQKEVNLITKQIMIIAKELNLG